MHKTENELSLLTDEELLAEAKKMKSTSVINGFIIGFMVGVIAYSVWKSSWGLLTLIPLYIAYKLFNDSKNYDDLKKVLKDRNLR